MKCSGSEKLNRRRMLVLALPFLAAALLLLYIQNACSDVVYSDYIRLVNSYLPDALAPETFFVPDVLTRIPFTYLARWVNVRFFGYSLTFDRVLGVLGLLLAGVMLNRYVLRVRLSVFWAVLLSVVMFSLNKWEMLLNGSGYAHFIAFGCFFWHYLVLERVYTGTAKKYDRLLLCLLPWVTTICIAGPYCAVYTVSVVLAYLYMWVSGNRNVEKKWYPRWLLCVLLPLFCYVLSNHFAVYEHAGAYEIGLLEALTQEFAFFPQFLLNGLASTVLGGETLEALLQSGVLQQSLVYTLGALVALGYIAALWLYVRMDLYKKTVFPLILLLSGMGNHAIVMLSRYIFLNERYAWSSRYALQYQTGVLGMLLVFALALSALRETRAAAQRKQQTHISGIIYILVMAFSLLFAAGNCYTSYQELQKMPYREANYEQKELAARDYRNVDDETLAQLFEYRKGADHIRRAFEILEENQLNVFR